MRWKFWEKPEYYIEDEVKSKKKPETLASVAEKLLIRKMKRDPDDYGLTAAERIKNIGKPEEKSLVGQLKELKQTQDLLRQLGGESGGSWLKEIGKSFAEAIAPTIGEIIQSKASQLPANRPQLDVGQPEPEPKPQPQRTEQFEFTDLVQVMDFEPQDAIGQLAQLNPTWVEMLARSDYSSFISLLEKVPSAEATDKFLRELLTADRQKWVEALIDAAKMVVQGG